MDEFVDHVSSVQSSSEIIAVVQESWGKNI